MRYFNYLAFMATIFCSNLMLNGSTCPAKAAPVGQNLWATLDIIRAFVYHGSLDSVITQTNIPFTISQPGYYFVRDDLVGGANDSPIITVSATDNVSLNLNNHVLTKDSATDSMVHQFISVINSSNVNIFDGSLYINDDGSASGTDQCVLVSTCTNIRLNNITMAAIDSSQTVSSAQGIIFENSTALSMQDCSVTGLYIGFSWESCNTILARRCQAVRSNAGFITSATNHSLFITCAAEACSSAGFLADGGSDDLIYRRCIAISCGLNSFATNSGFSMGSIDNGSISNAILYSCDAQFCGYNGFSVLGSTSVLICDSTTQGNAVDGFYTDTQTDNVNFVSCISSNNSDNGFEKALTSTAYAFNCYAQNNQSGINFLNFATPTRTNLSVPGSNYWQNLSTP